MSLRLKSVMKDLLAKYKEIKIASGIKGVSIDRYLNYIDDFYYENKIDKVAYTKEMHTSWLKPRNDREGDYVRYTRNNYLIEFLSFLKSLGYDVYIPRRLPHKSTNFTARIFSTDELEKYFEYVDSFFSYKDPMVALYVPVIFRILIGCGTRVGETLALRVEDVDIDEGLIHLKETKNSRFRTIPISPSLKETIIKYCDKCLYLKTNKDFFFCHIDNRRVNEQSIYQIHRKALSYAKIPYLGSTKGPRLHDLRHTFAVNSLKQFEDRGCDLYNVLPILKQYLGHTNISATEKYLQLVSENYKDVLNKTKETEDKILGENNDKWFFILFKKIPDWIFT